MSSSVTVTTSSTRLADVREAKIAGAADRDAVRDGAERFQPYGRARGERCAAPRRLQRPARRSLVSSGFAALATVAIPEISPPPPMPVMIVRTSGHCSRISSPTVPCPAITSGWSNGWIRIAPVRSANSCAATRLSSTVFPANSTFAPYALVAATFGSGAPTGMNTVDCAPSMPAAKATPCAWLPALAATTPRARSCVGQPGDAQIGAANLVGTGPLDVLTLEPRRTAQRRRQRAARLQRCHPDHAGEHLARCLDVLGGHQRRCWRAYGHAPIVP